MKSKVKQRYGNMKTVDTNMEMTYRHKQKRIIPNYILTVIILLFCCSFSALSVQSLLSAIEISINYVFLFVLICVLIAGGYFLFLRKSDLQRMDKNYHIFNKAAIVIVGSVFGQCTANYFLSFSMDGIDSALKSSFLIKAASGVCFFLIVEFIVWCGYSLLKDKKKGENPAVSGLSLGILAIVLNLGAIIHLVNSAMVYFWDTAGFWKTSIVEADLLFSNIGTFIKHIIVSINTDDYNYLPAAIPALIMKLTNSTSRFVFILTIVNFYALPALYAMCLTASAFVKRYSLKWDGNFPVLFAFLSIPLIMGICSVGFLDVAGLIFCGLALYFYIGNKNNKIPAFGAAGISLFMAYITRRWYLFWIVSFFLCAFGHQCILSAKKKQKLIQSVKNLFVMGLSFFVPLTVFFHKMVVDKLLKADYAGAYSAYKVPIMDDLQGWLIWYGLMAIILAVAFTVLLTIKKRYFALFLSAQAIITFSIFHLIQGHGQQHFLLYTPAVFVILAVGANELWFFAKNKTFKGKKCFANSLAALLLIVAGISHIVPFTHYDDINPVTARSETSTLPFYPGLSMRTYKRYDLVELLRLAADLDWLSEYGNQSIGFLSASMFFNVDIVKNVEYSLNIPISSGIKDRSYLLSYSSIDSRDSIPTYLYECEYVVVTDPVQVYMPEVQTVVSVPNAEFLNGTTIGAAFERTDSVYSLGDGTSVYIYQKVRTITEDEIAAFESKMPDIRR